MKPIVIAVLIGTIAGTIDVIPMLIMKLKRSDCISAFLHYLVLGLIIPFVSWDVAPVWKGIIISFLSAMPVMVGVFPTDKKALVPIMLFSVLLGAGIGWAGARFII